MNNEVFGTIGLLFLIISTLQSDMFLLRIINLLGTIFYLVQSLLLKNKSLIATSLVLLILNLVKISGLIFF